MGRFYGAAHLLLRRNIVTLIIRARWHSRKKRTRVSSAHYERRKKITRVERKKITRVDNNLDSL